MHQRTVNLGQLPPKWLAFSAMGITMLVGILVCAAMVLLSAGSVNEPEWEGKSLSWYLNDLKLFGAVNETPRKTTADALVAMGADCIPHLRQRLRSEDTFMLPFWIWLDENISSMDYPTRMATPSWAQKKQVFRAVPTLGFEAAPLIPDILDHLSDSELAFEAAWCLAAIGSRSIPPLVRLLESSPEDTRVRAAAVYALGFLSSKRRINEAYPVILQSLNDTSDEVLKRTLAAIRTMPLQEQGGDRVLALQHHPNPSVSREAAETVAYWERFFNFSVD